ncbi:CDGSH iron-sulfur domain-containing protein [bacterium]|nr:CDGSH iron-sulfur domain-containing protein [bacterium]
MTDQRSKSPLSMNLMPGIYFYCRCGKSAEFPLCDDSHRGTNDSPKKFRVDEPKSVYICRCGSTQSSPYCDGSHRGQSGRKDANAG